MCGIVGLAGWQDESWLSRMNAVLHHRGPDGSGEYRDREAGVGLAMSRLSIIDLVGGQQPMSNEDGAVWLVYNGEVYNAPEIRPRLEAAGHRFRTSHSDTEVLVHLYEERGEEMLDELNGMFAFVLFDRRRGTLFGARDRLGIKPLYYLERPDLFAFASEMKALLPLPSVAREVDPESLFHYMSLSYVPGASSILRGVRRLPPGHRFRYDLASRQLTIRRYWDFPMGRVETRPEAEWCELIRAGLRESIRRRMLSDVPVGCSLSGGTDSSIIVGLLGEMGYSKIKTYSLGFTGSGEEAWNELALARQVAERWGTDHHELVLRPEELLRDLVRMVWHLDEPYGGGLPSWYIFKFMRQEVTVGLTGTGGDEVFGNYGRYLRLEANPGARWIMAHRRALEAWGRRLAPWWRPVGRLAAALPGLDARRREELARLPWTAAEPLRRYYFNTVYHFGDLAKRLAVFQMPTEGIPDTARLLQGLYDASGAQNARDGIAYLDATTQLTDEFLFFTDRLSMAHSLEARVPFLDHTFVELAFRVPSSLRTRRDDVKHLLKQALSHLLPPDLLRAGKHGFVIPIALWLRRELRPLAERLLAPERLRRQGIFRADFHGRFVAPHLEDRADFTWQIWNALMFQLWHLVFIEDRANDVPAYGLTDLYR